MRDNLYLVVYDISNDKTRSKIDKILKGYGFRIQRSVFECRLARTAKHKLLKELRQITIKKGFIKIYKIAINSKKTIIGKTKNKSTDKKSAFTV